MAVSEKGMSILINTLMAMLGIDRAELEKAFKHGTANLNEYKSRFEDLERNVARIAMALEIIARKVGVDPAIVTGEPLSLPDGNSAGTSPDR